MFHSLRTCNGKVVEKLFTYLAVCIAVSAKSQPSKVTYYRKTPTSDGFLLVVPRPHELSKG